MPARGYSVSAPRKKAKAKSSVGASVAKAGKPIVKAQQREKSKADLKASLEGLAKTTSKAKLKPVRNQLLGVTLPGGSALTKAERKAIIERADKKTMSVTTAPAIAVLNETLRPVRASAGIAEQIVKGHPERAPKAAAKGLIQNKGPTYSKVLRDAGAPKGVAAVAGFALDVALDPTTYVTAGASVPARKAAESAARQATKQALAKGASRKVADRAGRAAAKVKLADPKLQNKGLTVGVRAKVPFTKKPQIDVRTSGKTTAAISRKTGLSTAATKVRESPKVQAIGESIVHDFRPKGVSRQGHDRVRAAQREYRAEVAQTRHTAERQAAALRKLIPDPDTSKLIIDHIQAGRPLRELGEHADAARAAKQILGRSFDAKKQAGLLHGPYRPRPAKLGEKTLKSKAATLKVERYGPSTDAKGYIPGVRRVDLEAGRKGVTPSRRVGVAKVAREQGKTFREPLAVYRESMPHVFSEDLPAILTHSVTKGHEKVAVANLWQKIAKTGRPLNPQTAKNIDLTDEMVFEVTPHGLVPLVKKGTDRAPDLAAIAKASETGGRHVILNRDSTMKLIEGSKNQQLPIGRVFDRAQGYWKTAVTATPGFHVRNLVGDSMNAFAADTTAVAYNQARKLLVAKAHRNKGERKSVATVDTTPKLTIGNTTKTERQWIREAEQHGAIDQGFMGAEVASQANRSPGKIMRGLQYREDLPRLATYLSGRERGMTPSQASEHVAKHHFDYGDLTATERATRRYAIPFWCVPEDHEVLTRRGFKRHGELIEGEDVMALDHETGVMEWTPLLEVATFDYDGPLKTIKRRGADFAFTPDHRWPVVSCATFHRRLNKHYGGRRSIKRTYDLCRSDRIPLTGEFRSEGESSLSPRHAAILGWLVGDGYFRWRGNHCEMMVYQSPRKHLDAVIGLLENEGRNPHPQTGVVAVPVRMADSKALRAAGFRSKDDLLSIIGGLSREAAEAMWQALFDAEGWTTPGTGQQGFSQVAGPVLEAFQMLCYLTGRACSLGAPRATGHGGVVNQTYVRKQGYLQVKDLGDTHYRGTIWCPRTKHGTWVMRHNGTVIVTGNTFFARNTRLQATKVITRPGKVATLGKFMEEAAQLAGYDDYEAFAKDLPDFQQRGLPIPIKTGDKVTTWTWMPPATDLNALSTKPSDFAQNVAQRLTAAKLIGELYLNKSIFFQGDIEHENARLVPAPQVLGSLPEDLRKHFGIEKFRDKRRGMIWGWPGKTDYIARQTPQTNVLVQALTPVPGSRGKSGQQAATGMLTGFKPSGYAGSVEDEAVRRASDKLHKLNVEKSNLLKTPKAKDADGYASPKLVKLRAKIKTQEQAVKDLKSKRGDDTSEQRIELSPADEMKREFEEFSDPKAQQRKLVEEFEEFAKGGP